MEEGGRTPSHHCWQHRKGDDKIEENSCCSNGYDGRPGTAAECWEHRVSSGEKTQSWIPPSLPTGDQQTGCYLIQSHQASWGHAG